MTKDFDSLRRTAERLLTEHPEIIITLSKRLGLMYKTERDVSENVCFIESEEVRPEFRETFIFVDVVNYLFGLAHSSAYHTNIKDFSYPDGPEIFWRLVK